MAKNVGYICL